MPKSLVLPLVLSSLAAAVSLTAFAQTSAAAAPATPAASVADRVAAQNALFEESYQLGLKNSPERATAIGDYRYNALLGDASLAHIAEEHSQADAFLARIRAIPTAGMSDSDLLSHELFERQLARADIGYALKNYEMPINQQNGVHSQLADLPNSVPLDSVQHYEDYIARLQQIPRVLQQSTEVLRAGVKDGLMPPKIIVDKLPAQCDGIIAADPFLLPLKKFPASFAAADKQRLTTSLTRAVNEQVLPAYRAFATFLREEYDPHGRTVLSIESLPDGKRRYAEAIRSMTTIDITPAQVHAIGLSEVARITAEMTALARAQGYPTLAAFREAINKDPRWTPTSEGQIVADFQRYIDQMEPKLPELFDLLPKGPVFVEPIPSFNAAVATHYNSGTPDGRRPGRVSVAVADPTHRTMVDDEAVAYHEGVPGHHLQISVAQQLTGLPKFRLRGGYTAYTEGWALYAEELGKEVGFYKDPVSDYGRLNSELFRAVRLVVDTGIHDLGWSRERVIAYMHDNDVNDVQAQAETDRYIAWPAQALAYKMGQLKIRELRERARAQLGANFSLKAFHDEVLNGGALPLDLLEARVDRWIKTQMPQNASR